MSWTWKTDSWGGSPEDLNLPTLIWHEGKVDGDLSLGTLWQIHAFESDGRHGWVYELTLKECYFKNPGGGLLTRRTIWRKTYNYGDADELEADYDRLHSQTDVVIAEALL